MYGEIAPKIEGPGLGYGNAILAQNGPMFMGVETGYFRMSRTFLMTLGTDRLSGLTEASQAERFVKTNRDRLRYDHTRKKWLIYQSPLWVPDPDGQVTRLAIDEARRLQLEGQAIADTDVAKKVIGFAKTFQSEGGIRRVQKIAQSLPPLANIGGAWDLDPLLLGTPTGVFNLETGRLRGGRPEDMLTRSTTAVYDARATCPRWEQFLRELFPRDVELVRYVQRAVGCSLTGLTTEQVWWLLHGSGANGKSTFLNVVRHVLGAYSRTIPFSTILLPERSIPDDLAGLPGVRFVFASEAIEEHRLNEARIKALTGGDRVATRHLYGLWFEFTPQLKLWLCCNHLPTVRDSSHGFWRRVHVIPFTQRFVGASRDQGLERALIEEASGILRWMVRGALDWRTNGLQPPDCVVQATEQYQEESDHLSDFLAERCEQRAELSVSATELYGNYATWAVSRNLPPAERLSQAAFGRRVGDRFQKSHRQTGNFYVGLDLRRVP